MTAQNEEKMREALYLDLLKQCDDKTARLPLGFKMFADKVWQAAIAQERIESQKREAELQERVSLLEEERDALAVYKEDEHAWVVRNSTASQEEVDERTKKCVVACMNLADDQLQFAYEVRCAGLFEFKKKFEAMEAELAKYEETKPVAYVKYRVGDFPEFLPVIAGKVRTAENLSEYEPLYARPDNAKE
jgi:hypothetical protein